jgi:predicted enzyme related to lactoylglutathione lyase
VLGFVSEACIFVRGPGRGSHGGAAQTGGEVDRNVIRIRLRWLAVLASLGAGVQAGCAAVSPLPPLTDPATDAHLPGKFVWADIFSSDVAGTRRFYGSLFGWDWRWISDRPGRRYGIFINDGAAVAGLAHVEAPDGHDTYARWVHYISVEDVGEAAAGAEARGGRVMLPAHAVAERGEFAVLADAQDAPFGVMRSSSGDPEDFRAAIGEWLWAGLAARDAAGAAEFYASLFGYEVFPREDESGLADYVLARGGHSRAAIAQLGPDADAAATWIGYVRVADLAATLAEARALGGVVLYETAVGSSGGELAVVEDPFGALIGLIRWTFPEEDADRAEAQP